MNAFKNFAAGALVGFVGFGLFVVAVLLGIVAVFGGGAS